MNSKTLAAVVRQCAEVSILITRRQVDKFAADHRTRTASLHSRLAAVATAAATLPHRSVGQLANALRCAEALLANAVRCAEAALASSDTLFKTTAQECTNHLSNLPNLLLALLRDLGAGAPSHASPGVVCSKVDAALRPHLASISEHLRYTTLDDERQLLEVEQLIQNLERSIADLRKLV